jgi:hypothetical protein
MSANPVNLLNVDPTQTQFDGINNAMNTINSEITYLNNTLTADVNTINT